MSSRRAHALDSLRGLAAAGVVAHHVWQNVLPTTAIVGGAAWMDLRLGVVFFFCLSGYLLYGPWVKAALDPARPAPALGRYVRHRAARILPLYWLALLVSVAILHGSGSFREVSDWRLLAFVAFAQNWFPETAGRLDPPMWTLTVEVAFYALLPVVGWLSLRGARAGSGRRPRARQLAAVTALAGLGLAYCALAEPGGPLPEVQRVLPSLLPVFACGMAARVLTEGRTINRHAARVLALAGATAVVLFARGDLATPYEAVVRELPVAAGFAAVCAGMAVPGAAPRILSSRPLVALGTLSYGIYLWHYPVLLALRRVGELPERLPVAIAVVGALSLLLAWLSWRLVEKPVLDLVARREAAGRRAGRAARAPAPPRSARRRPRPRPGWAAPLSPPA